MSVQTDPIPPVPEHTPPLKEDESTRGAGKFFNQAWTRWFVSLRDKINVISDSLVNLGNVTGAGIVVKNGASWFTRTITGTAGRISVTNGSGTGGNPTIDLVNTAVTPGSYVNTNLTVDAAGRLTAASSGSAAGDVVGPASATADAIVLFNGITGKIVKDSTITMAALAAFLQGTGLDVDAAGFRGIPQNSQSGNYTTLATDSGKEIYHPSGAGAGDTFSIDSNANVPYELGTVISFCNMDSNPLSIAIVADTMRLAGPGTTGTRTLAQFGTATAKKDTTTSWLISGIGLT